MQNTCFKAFRAGALISACKLVVTVLETIISILAWDTYEHSSLFYHGFNM